MWKRREVLTLSKPFESGSYILGADIIVIVIVVGNQKGHSVTISLNQGLHV